MELYSDSTCLGIDKRPTFLLGAFFILDFKN